MILHDINVDAVIAFPSGHATVNGIELNNFISYRRCFTIFPGIITDAMLSPLALI